MRPGQAAEGWPMLSPLHGFSGGVLWKGLGFPHILLSFGLLDFQFFMVITYIHKERTYDAQIMYKD